MAQPKRALCVLAGNTPLCGLNRSPRLHLSHHQKQQKGNNNILTIVGKRTMGTGIHSLPPPATLGALCRRTSSAALRASTSVANTQQQHQYAKYQQPTNTQQQQAHQHNERRRLLNDLNQRRKYPDAYERWEEIVAQSIAQQQQQQQQTQQQQHNTQPTPQPQPPKPSAPAPVRPARAVTREPSNPNDCTLPAGLTARFEVGSNIGSGSFANVFKAKRKSDGVWFAVKRVPLVLSPLKEVALLSRIQHHNVIRLESIFQTHTHEYMVLELCTGGELFERIARRDTSSSYSETHAARMIAQILSAVDACHKAGVTHRDIKPENVLCETNDEETSLRLIDFGCARCIRPITHTQEYHNNIIAPRPTSDEEAAAEPIPIRFHDFVGSPTYVAPEVLMQNYNESCDLWSVGVILYILLCGRSPWRGESARQIAQSVVHDPIDFSSPPWDRVSDAGKAVVKALLSRDALLRPSAAEALTFEWFKGINEEHWDEQLRGYEGRHNLEGTENQEGTFAERSALSDAENGALLAQTVKNVGRLNARNKLHNFAVNAAAAITHIRPQELHIALLELAASRHLASSQSDSTFSTSSTAPPMPVSPLVTHGYAHEQPDNVSSIVTLKDVCEQVIRLGDGIDNHQHHHSEVDKLAVAFQKYMKQGGGEGGSIDDDGGNVCANEFVESAHYRRMHMEQRTLLKLFHKLDVNCQDAVSADALIKSLVDSINPTSGSSTDMSTADSVNPTSGSSTNVSTVDSTNFTSGGCMDVSTKGSSASLSSLVGILREQSQSGLVQKLVDEIQGSRTEGSRSELSYLEFVNHLMVAEKANPWNAVRVH